MATQIAIASEDDVSPVVQLWDLRMAQAPLKQFTGHKKGIMDIKFSTKDTNLMMSISRDNTLKVWDFANSECVYRVFFSWNVVFWDYHDYLRSFLG